MAVVLIVDEDLALLKRLHTLLRRKGVDCFATRGTDTALAAFAVAEMDLVVADRAVLERRGWELGRRLRELTTAPIIMTSRYPLDDELGDARLIDAATVLYKPLDESRFWPHIEPFLASRRSEAEA